MKRIATYRLRTIGFIVGLLTAMLCLCSCSKQEMPVSTKTPVSCHTEAQAAYSADNYRNFKLYANGTEELSAPVPVIIGKSGVVAQLPVPKIEESDGEEENEEEVTKKPVVASNFSAAYVTADVIAKEAISKDYDLYISTKEDMSDSKIVSGHNSCVEIYNLLLGKTYYCQIASSDKRSEVFSFTTETQAPRNLFVDGVTNARDLGGWSTESGGKVRQGLIYRTSKFNKDESDELMITDEGIRTMTEEFGVRTEIDLRTTDDNENGGITESPLGAGVKYVSIPFQSGGNILLLNRESMAELFSVLGNSDNYPLVFHCSIGTDRTGAVAFLINGLMGVAKDDLYRDFLFSNFGKIGSMRTPSIINTYYDTVDLSAGSTLSEKIYNWLVGNGVAAEDLENLKKILTEE